jgi:hypothetical protein
MFGKYDNLSGIVPPATGMASRWGVGGGDHSSSNLCHGACQLVSGPTKFTPETALSASVQLPHLQQEFLTWE